MGKKKVKEKRKLEKLKDEEKPGTWDSQEGFVERKGKITQKKKGVWETKVLGILLFDIHEAQGDVVVNQIVVEGAKVKDKTF